MAIPFGQVAFTLGEVSPSLFARTDLARYKVGASTARNGFCRYSGGFYSRAGTAFVGFSKQTGRSFPPRVIGFQFNIQQGLALEFGNFYLRVIQNGAYVTEGPLPVLNISTADPAVVTTSAEGAQSATPNNGAVSVSYSPGDQITLDGGTFSMPAVLSVATTELLSTTPLNRGSGFVPADTIHVDGGVQTSPIVLTVATTQVVAAAVFAAGSGGVDGVQTVTGTTGTGTPFEAFVQVTGGAIVSVLSVSVPGSYTVNPTNITNEPVTGASLVGSALAVTMGVGTVTVTDAGTLSSNPSTAVLMQTATSGIGVGSSFQNSLFGPHDLTIVTPGAYTIFPANPVAQASTTGSGLGATFDVTPFLSQPYNVGDWVAIDGVTGMTQINGRTFVVAAATSNTITLSDVYGNLIDSTTFGLYGGGGTIERIYTVVAPYSEQDLAWLKWTQSNNVMSICCVNQETSVSYQPFDLRRNTDTDWVFTAVSPGPVIGAPTGVSTSASSGGASTYGFIVTAVASDGSESLGSTPVFATSAVDIFATAGTITVSWGVVAGATAYNVYQAAISFSGPQPDGTPYGIVASVTGTSWQNSNTVPDFTRTAPIFSNPFQSPDQFPSVVSYFQERRMYANTLSQPETYFLSQPGSFTNFDTRNPPVSDDAIIGSPWVTQVNGIQALVDMPGGAVVLTGREAWQLTGQGGSSFNPQPVTPTTQQAQPQAFNGCHDHILPFRIDYDILYVQAKGSHVRDLNYNFYSNIYTGEDICLNSAHLFDLYQIQEWCYAEEPFKLIAAVRTDGCLLFCTFLKPEKIVAWTRNDTQGSFVSVCSVTEPPVDAIYVACQRQIGGNTAYTVERMDDRLWTSIDDSWCVDAGQSLPQPEPSSTLMIGSWTGAIINPVVVDGGIGYSAGTQIVVIDDNGAGSGAGAVVTPTISGTGAITALSGGGGAGYTNPRFYAVDPAGSEGGSEFEGTCSLQMSVPLRAPDGAFSAANIGDVVRAAGGIAQVTGVADARHATASIIVPFSGVLPIDNNLVSITPSESFTPVAAGNWSMTTPVTTVGGLYYLAGASVVGVADSVPFGPVTVAADGTITLDTPASNVVVGLGFPSQLQSLYLDTAGSPTSQGQRKRPAAVTIRVEASRGFEAGADQVDGSTLSPPQTAPTWRNMTDVPQLGVAPFGTTYVPLATGDIRVPVPSGYTTKAQIAVQQTLPLPMSILDFIIEDEAGDLPQTRAPRGKQDAMVEG